MVVQHTQRRWLERDRVYPSLARHGSLVPHFIAQGWGRNANSALVLTAQAPARQNVLLSAVQCGRPFS